MSDWLSKYGGKAEEQTGNHQPTMADAQEEVRKRNMSAKATFYALCRERGLNPQEPMDLLKRLAGGGR